MEELEAGKISGVPVDEAEVYKRLGTTMPAAASEMMRYIFSGPNIAQGPGKTTKSPKYTTKILYWLRNDL